MELTPITGVSTALTSTTFPLLVEQIVEEILQAKSYRQVCYLMGRIMGAKHMIEFDVLSPEQIVQMREALNPLTEHSHVLAWALKKPYGYAGDFVALELLYDRTPSGMSSPLGQLLDRWLLDAQLGIGVRERKDMLSAFIERNVVAHNEAGTEPFRMLSLAAGSARELRDLSPELLGSMDITLVDQDERSLQFASSHLPDTVTTMKRNALRLRPSAFPHHFDLAYSFGFFDYLSDELIVHSLKLCSSVVGPFGSVLFPLKIDSKFRHWFYDVFLDWRFVKREMEDGMRLAKLAGLDVVGLVETENESVLFYHCVPRQI